MMVVKGLIWDDWNRKHLAKHHVTPDEVEEVCHGKHRIVESFRKRLQISGRTAKGRKLIIILSPEDRHLRSYREGMYYPITAFGEEV